MSTNNRTYHFAGAVALLFALLALGWGARVASAQDLPPRPTVVPPPQPTAQPTAAPRREEQPAPAPTGRITGTVIDQTTSAPAAGVAVQIGDLTTISDVYGNYWRDGLAPGTYMVAVQPSPAQGAASQAPVAVLLEADATVIQHLAFRSPAASIAAPVSDPQPVVAPAAALQPAQLPMTSAPAGAAWHGAGVAMALLGLGLVLRRRVSLRE